MGSLQFKNVNKIYSNGFHAVHDFSLDVKDGEFIVFVGPSGCGKSTVLRMMQVWKPYPAENWFWMER